jgi:hypothetical protein
MKTISIAVVAVAALAGCSSADDTPPLDIVAASAPLITSVTTDDGFTQVRQSATVSLVIRGNKLGKTTGVIIAGFYTTLDSVTSHEVRVTVYTSNDPPGPLDVTVTIDDGSATVPGAIELTPFVVSPTAVTGHGTFQSPMNLCDPEFGSTDAGSIVLLLAGTHRCGSSVYFGGGTVSGDPDHPTILTGTDAGGFGIGFSGFQTSLTIRDVTFAPPLAEWSVAADSGDLIMERIVDAGGISIGSRAFLWLDHYTYEGEGTAFSVAAGQIKHASIRHCGAHDAIFVSPSYSGVAFDGLLVEDCERGAVAQGPVAFENIGLSISNAQLHVHRAGIAVNNGSTGLHNVQISGHDDVGISIIRGQSDNHAAQLWADGLEIIGGRIGIEIRGLDNQLIVRNSIIRDQTQASLAVSNLDGRTDLGTPDDPGNNQLSVLSGFAIDDSRFSESGRYIRAVGTTLNGVSFAGQTIDGGELPPYYRVLFSGAGIQF